jgi:hypothetical protein
MKMKKGEKPGIFLMDGEVHLRGEMELEFVKKKQNKFCLHP